MTEINQDYIKYLIIIIILSLIGCLVYFLYRDLMTLKSDINSFKNEFDQQKIVLGQVQNQFNEEPEEFDEDESDESDNDDEEELHFDLHQNPTNDMFGALNSILEETEEEPEEQSIQEILEEIENEHESQKKCEATLKSGKNKGQICGKPIIGEGITCKLHQ